MVDKIVSHSFITHGAVSILANELSHENARLMPSLKSATPENYDISVVLFRKQEKIEIIILNNSNKFNLIIKYNNNIHDNVNARISKII